MNRWVLIVLGVCVVVVGAIVGASSGLLGGDPAYSQKAAKHHAPADGGQKASADKRREYLALPYPKPSGKLPPSITTSYDRAKDRTKMTIRLTPLRVVASGNFRAGDVEMRIVSEFSGTVRPRDVAESSVTGVIIVGVDTTGLLASTGAPGSFSADAVTVEARPASGTKSGYSASKNNNTEAMAFKIDVKDMIPIAGAQGLKARFGLLEVEFTPAQIADLREFAARLNPNPS